MLSNRQAAASGSCGPVGRSHPKRVGIVRTGWPKPPQALRVRAATLAEATPPPSGSCEQVGRSHPKRFGFAPPRWPKPPQALRVRVATLAEATSAVPDRGDRPVHTKESVPGGLGPLVRTKRRVPDRGDRPVHTKGRAPGRPDTPIHRLPRCHRPGRKASRSLPARPGSPRQARPRRSRGRTSAHPVLGGLSVDPAQRQAK